jgi:fructosamine-3-kinase
LTLPGWVRRGVEAALSDRGLGRRVEQAVPVGGGCINNGARIESDSGATLFLKWNPSSPTGMFEAEAHGLRALSAGSSLRVPEPLTWGGASDGAAWLLMEYVAPGRSSIETERAFGKGLAEMHSRAVAGGFGFTRDNWIGSLEQGNAVSDRWADFWRDCRIAPQLSLARAHGRARDADFDSLLEVIPAALAGVERPELVHGDLWGGNWFASERGEPVVIDPAAYHGHGEVDLAMSQLFGGFGASFYEAYRDVRDVARAYDAYRKDLYQLYYLLVHVNLFGAAYEAASLDAAQRVLSELR